MHMFHFRRHPRVSLVALALLACGSGGVARAAADSRLPQGAVLASGYNHQLFIKPDGQIWSWGANTWGQLGDGTNTDARTPIRTNLADVVHVATGSDFSLAIDGNSKLWAWGHNDKGQLGRGTTSTSASAGVTPTKVDDVGNWRIVAAGFNHAVGITFDGGLWGWGSNGSSQLCKAATTAESRPISLSSAKDWMAVGAGLNFTVALKADGTLWGCGSNGSGQLNQGTTGGIKTALTQMGTDRWVSFSVGTGHVIAIRDDGTLWAWGLNDKGQVGNGTTTDVPTQFQLSAWGWRAVSAGDRHSLAVQSDGSSWGWGDNFYYQLATSSSTGVFTSLTRIGSQFNWEHVSAGQGFSVGIRATGTLETWGRGAMLGIGSGAPNSSTTKFPQPAGQSTSWYQFSKPGTLSAGMAHAVAIRSDGKLQTWGNNNDGQLGNGNRNNVVANYSPQVPANVSSGPWLSVAAGEQFTLGVKADGTLWVWGGNNNGEQGDGTQGSTPTLTPHQLMSGVTFVRVFAHYAQCFALAATGKLYAWGDNSMGQLGVNKTNDVPAHTPTLVVGTAPYRAVGTAAHTSHFITSKGELYAAGQNGGLLGVGGTDNVLSPKRVGTAVNWVATAEGLGYGMALAANGVAYGWGSNNEGQLGNTSLGDPVASPKAISTNLLFSRLSIAEKTVLGTSTKGNVYGWGENGMGQICNGDLTTYVFTPTLSFFFQPRELVGGSAFFLSNSANGGIRYSCGANDYGQLGNGSKGGLAADPLIITGSF
jgi:alpha-tubulin suppressor-like RCC1 family protein